ncbi:MAG: rod shape-determining protein MreC [Treponema sp.]|jgi:rod shape-determining protein MreC|nr:rod shape-determining protein MreC [Treponema sp.]
MTRNNPDKRRRVGGNAYVFAALIIISFSVLLFSTRSVMSDFSQAGLSSYSGLRQSIYRFSSFVSGTVLSIRELAELKEQYDELAARISRYEQLERSAADIRQENGRLREQLGFSQSLSYRHIAAEIIGRDPDSLFSALVVNRGTRDGVAVNMPVIAYQNGVETLVGKVVQAAALESLVMPLYDSTSYVSSRLAESRIEGIVEGQGAPDAPLLLRFVRRRSRGEISVGEPVLTSGLGGVFPPGIILGRVNRVLYQDTDTSIEIELESSADFSRLEYVFVIDAKSAAVREAAGNAGEGPGGETAPEVGNGAPGAVATGAVPGAGAADTGAAAGNR